jgi:hypothetical protein
MFATLAQVLSLAAVVAALYFSAAQTRKLQRQIELSNLFSRYEALNHASERYDAGLALLFQRPDLRPYVLGSKPLDLRGEDLARALIVADQMLGAVDYAIRVGSRFPDGTRGGWEAVAVEMAKRPLFRALVEEKAHEFPDAVKYFGPDDGRPAPTP